MSSAWVQEEINAKRVLLAIISPVDYTVSIAWSKRFNEICSRLPVGSAPFWITGLPFDAARNAGVAECLKGGYGYLGFLDADTIPEKPDCFTTLMATGLPLVAGIYRQRFPPFKLAAFNAATTPDGKSGSIDLPMPLPWGQVAPVDYVPTGLMLIRRDVLEAFMARGDKKPFDWTMNPLVGEGRSEDYEFCSKAKAMGIQPYLHFGVLAYHEIKARIQAQDGQLEFGLFVPDKPTAIGQP